MKNNFFKQSQQKAALCILLLLMALQVLSQRPTYGYEARPGANSDFYLAPDMANNENANYSAEPYMAWIIDSNNNEGPGGYAWWADGFWSPQRLKSDTRTNVNMPVLADLLMFLDQKERNLLIRKGGYKSQDAGLADYGRLKLIADHDNSGDGIISFGNGGLFSSSNFTELMRMTDDGKFGIGTSSPSSLLHINGPVQNNGSYNYDYQNTQGFIGVRHGLGLVTGTNNYTKYSIEVKNENAWYPAVKFISPTIVNSSYPEAHFYGKIGVNTTSPESGLHVKGLIGGITAERNGIKVRMDADLSATEGWIGTISNHGLFLGTNNSGSNIYLDTDDNVYIGGNHTVSSNLKTAYDLFVDNGILTEDIAIAAKNNWSDYVFGNDYKLKKLSEVEDFINKNKHLPNIPSQETIRKEGYNMHDMNVLFLEKIEELTLYTIEQQKLIETLKKEMKRLKRIVDVSNQGANNED